MSKVIISTLYYSDVFRMACRQFDQTADAINRAGTGSTRREVSLRQTAITELARIDATTFEVPEAANCVRRGPATLRARK